MSQYEVTESAAGPLVRLLFELCGGVRWHLASACVAAAEHGDAEECARHVHGRVHTLQLVNFWRDLVRATRVGGASRRVPGYRILALGYTMVTITTLSLSAIATNGKVKGAGGVVLLCRVVL